MSSFPDGRGRRADRLEAIAGYRLPRLALSFEDDWQLTQEDLEELSRFELRLERHRVLRALAFGARRLDRLIIAIGDEPLTARDYLRRRLSAIDRLLGGRGEAI